jgi:periplasmic divalent cation tolerance protein
MLAASDTPCDRANMKLIAVFTSVGSLDEARRIAGELVERRLVACAQICEIESFYRWDGALQNEREYRVLLKTRAALYGAVEAAIRERHSYELPAIHAVAIEQAYAPYAAWIEQGCSGGA